MSIDIQSIDKLATLSRLSFTDDEKVRITGELSKILDFVSQLQEVDTEGVHTMTSPAIATSTPERDDVVVVEKEREDLIRNAPQQEMGFYVVPRVVE